MHQSRITMEEKHNDLTEIITQALNEMKMEQGKNFDIDKVNLAELQRRTGITRAKLRRIKDKGFVDLPSFFQQLSPQKRLNPLFQRGKFPVFSSQ